MIYFHATNEGLYSTKLIIEYIVNEIFTWKLKSSLFCINLQSSRTLMLMVLAERAPGTSSVHSNFQRQKLRKILISISVILIFFYCIK